MKLNEKNVASFAVSKSPVDKEGWLLKRGEVNKSFQRRYFVLKGNLLFYFEKKTEKEPSGVIILEGCTIELAEFEEQYAFKIVFHGAGDRTYVLGADTQETMESWMKALACASYDYVKLMVSELQRQLDEMIELEKAHSLSIFDDQTEKGGSTLRNGSAGNPKAHSVEGLQCLPTAPPRCKGSRYKRDTALQPGQRINPFNRCQSEEDFEKSYSACSMLPSSAPGTPRSQHHNVHYRTNFDQKCVEKLQGRRAPTPMLHQFYELHNKYGIRIRSDIDNWQLVNKGKCDPPVGQLISFE